MNREQMRSITGRLKRNRQRRTWKKVIGALACMVVFCTVYALILPAITLEKAPQCGKIEHTHSQDCYAPEPEESEAALEYTSTDIEMPTDIDMPENPGEAEDTEAGSETEEDSAAQGVLICGLEEHTHTAECSAIDPVEEQPAQEEEEPQQEVLLTEDTNMTVANADGADANSATLEEMGIYLGEQQEDGTWVACDGKTEEDASIKATITLPEGVTAPEGYRLFIRKINEGEGYYPQENEILAETGAINGWQCYTIRWITQREDGSLQMQPLNVSGQTIEVKISYLKEEARLPGLAGGRKLQIYNSNPNGTLQEQVADTVKNVLVSGDTYTEFTFEASSAGPYVFVSKYLEQGYIEHIGFGSIVDGSAPFDSTDRAGYDSGTSNRIVRSYDTIQYNLSVNFAARQQEVTKPETKMYFVLTLGKSATAARFAFDKMMWLGEHYGVEYLNDKDEVVMVMDHKGSFYEPRRQSDGTVERDESGFALPNTDRPVSFNSQVSGSLAGKDSYKVATGGVTKQRLVGWTMVMPTDGSSNALVGTQTFTMAVEVRNADNDEIFSPTFHLWLEGNEDNYGPETLNTEDNTLIPAVPVAGNSITADGDNAVRVSAGTNYNLQIKKNSDMSYKNWFDFSTGDAVAEPTRSELVRLANLTENHGISNPAEFTENGQSLSSELKAQYANYRYGRMTCYGITVQLYTNTDNDPDKNRSSKGLKGMSLPVGDITFDVNFSSSVKSGSEVISPDEYTAILWDYNENVPAENSYRYDYKDPAYPAEGQTIPARGRVVTPNDGRGNGGRRLYWDSETRSSYAKGGAPSNYLAYHDGCYYGGDWALVGDFKEIATPTKVTGSGKDTTYHFKISDYDFDFDTQHFPKQDAGNSGNVTGYDTYARAFSAGDVQVLSVFPMVQKTSVANIQLNVEVSNLHLSTRAGQVCKPETSKYDNEVNQKDNQKTDNIVLYAPGSLTKGSSFNGLYKGEAPKNTSEGFLGSEYWTTSYDCSAFAGDNIWLMSYGMISSGGDYRTKSMNLLQLFDSRALRVRDIPDLVQNYDKDYDEPGTATFLYAADPDYPEGYDTNREGILAYMNSVREEDLVYSTEMPDKDGYITYSGSGLQGRYKCVGVLMELRGCNLLGGRYQYLRIPVKLTGDDAELVSKTVATVNAFRVWSDDQADISWANGVWDPQTQANTLTGYKKPDGRWDANGYSAELANTEKGKLIYTKTEYKDGMKVDGTHSGGTLAGNSLLVLSYKANVDVTIDNKPSESGAYIYHQGNGESVVDYRLCGIIANVSDLTSQSEVQKTTLNIKVVLDEKNKTDTDRLLVSGGSYRMQGYAVGADGKPVGELQDFSISTNPKEPTTLAFQATDGQFYTIQVYAATRGSQSVAFTIQNAPVGLRLPDITFKADFGSVEVLNNNDTFQTGAYISGTGDVRAYDEAKGNACNVTVGVVVDNGTNLAKSVNHKYIELDGQIQYTVSYLNRGGETLDKVFFYDLFPDPNDIRDSEFGGDIILVDFKAQTRGDGEPCKVTVYYTTHEAYQELYNTVKVFGGEWSDAANQAHDMDADKVETMLDGSGSSPVQFSRLGTVEDGAFKRDQDLPDDPAELLKLMEEITGLYVKVEDLKGYQSVDLIFELKTVGNKANEIYRNIANSWIAGSQFLPLVSNRVQTQVLSRSISGIVWYDHNLNGIYDDGEQLLSGVTATLLKKNAKGEYEPCTKDVTGQSIDICQTDDNGEYAFHKLEQGDYIVAFSGEGLEQYTDVTTYQVNKQNDAVSSDGKKIAVGTAQGGGLPGGYLYYICYSGDSADIKLHSLDEVEQMQLVGGVELYDHQDLGLIIATHELPETGGIGTISYTVGGGLLIAVAGILLLYRRKKSEKEDMTSS